MRINHPIRLGRYIFMVFVFLFAGTCSLWATTVEVENEDEDIFAVSTATPLPSNMKPNIQKNISENKNNISAPPTSPAPPPSDDFTDSKSTQTPSEKSSMSFLKRVRINEKVGFYYFLSAGYLTSDSHQVPSIGNVMESTGLDLNYSTPKKTFIKLTSSQNDLKPDDLLVIFRQKVSLHQPNSLRLGYQVEILAIVKVIEIQKRRIFVEVKKSFSTFRTGDLVESYDNEIKRWKQAQIKKVLPSQPIKCFVLGGSLSREFYEQTDYIYLTSGIKSGVVEGQKFQLAEAKNIGALEEPVHQFRGVAQVIYAGPNFSTAQILSNNDSIQKGFEASYKP